jgi:hypothetical protein
LVSPLKRALRTCRNVFYYYNNVKKIVLPELTEAFRYACDINTDIHKKIEEFKEMDFTNFHSINNDIRKGNQQLSSNNIYHCS